MASILALFIAAALAAPIDVHAHLEPAKLDESIPAALRAGAAQIFLLPPPFTEDDPARYDVELFLPALKAHSPRLRFLGGGGTLNPMIQRWRNPDAETRRRFRERAEELLRLGAAGFGEMTAEHFQGGTAYQSVPPDHPLFLLLTEIAGAAGVPIDLHLEALRENIAAFERLLNHDPRARILWAHAGTDDTGHRTPALCRRLLDAHPNLYMELKIDPLKPGKNPLSIDGAIEKEWLRLFLDHPDRFVLGSDQHYPGSGQRWQAVLHLLNQLPAELRAKIGSENAARLFDRKEGNR